MRIIAGEFRGRTIKFPKSKLVRPTTDKTKESIFNYLSNKIDFDDMVVCDLYSGSGSLGIEALSRGAKEVHFVEKNFPVYKNLLNTIETLKIANRTKLFKMSCLKFTSSIKDYKYDLILADPPFFHDDIHKVVNNIRENSILNPEGILLVERSVQTEINDVEDFGIKPIKKLGDSLIYEFFNS